MVPGGTTCFTLTNALFTITRFPALGKIGSQDIKNLCQIRCFTSQWRKSNLYKLVYKRVELLKNVEDQGLAALTPLKVLVVLLIRSGLFLCVGRIVTVFAFFTSCSIPAPSSCPVKVTLVTCEKSCPV